MVHYILSLSNIPFFNIIPNGTKHIHKKKKKLYNIFDVHENATLPLFIPKHMFFVGGSFSNCVVLMIKNAFKQ
jgi:hypothetical protein